MSWHEYKVKRVWSCIAAFAKVWVLVQALNETNGGDFLERLPVVIDVIVERWKTLSAAAKTRMGGLANRVFNKQRSPRPLVCFRF